MFNQSFFKSTDCLKISARKWFDTAIALPTTIDPPAHAPGRPPIVTVAATRANTNAARRRRLAGRRTRNIALRLRIRAARPTNTRRRPIFRTSASRSVAARRAPAPPRCRPSDFAAKIPAGGKSIAFSRNATRTSRPPIDERNARNGPPPRPPLRPLRLLAPRLLLRGGECGHSFHSSISC